jgi:hypothetical protein
VSNQRTEFADFFQASWEPCLRAVVAVVGRPQLAEDQVAEAFAKAWGSWRKVSPPSGSAGVGGAHRAEHRGVVVAAAAPRAAPG